MGSTGFFHVSCDTKYKYLAVTFTLSSPLND